jgi:hypothetical protein
LFNNAFLTSDPDVAVGRDWGFEEQTFQFIAKK